jgi:SAM-dependent methyltransferase
MSLQVNIGAGASYIPGFVNVDIAEHADVSLDLNTSPLPFEDGSVDLVFSYHTLEHLERYLFALGEIHRVLRHGGRFLVGLPYVTLTYWHQVNPYHLHDFNEGSFDFFDPARLMGSAVEQGPPIVFKKVFHRYHYMGAFHLAPPPLRSWCRRHLLNTVRKIDFGLLAVKERAPVRADPRALRAEFDRLLAARRPYGTQPAAPAGSPSLGMRLVRARQWWSGER